MIIDGEDIGQFNKLQLTNYRRSHVGLVFQFYNLMPNLTDKENVEIAAELSKDSLDPEKTLSSVGLEDNRLLSRAAFRRGAAARFHR